MQKFRLFIDRRPEFAAFSAVVDIETDGDRRVGPLIAETTPATRQGVSSDVEKYLVDDYALRDFLQAVVDEAYQKLNITPSGWTAEMKAQKYHLEDMRKLVLKDRA